MRSLYSLSDENEKIASGKAELLFWKRDWGVIVHCVPVLVKTNKTFSQHNITARVKLLCYAFLYFFFLILFVFVILSFTLYNKMKEKKQWSDQVG